MARPPTINDNLKPDPIVIIIIIIIIIIIVIIIIENVAVNELASNEKCQQFG